MKLYKVIVHKAFDGTPPAGMLTSLLIGDEIDVEDVPHVRMAHGVIEPTEGWYATLAIAQRKAADEIAEIGRRITQQAACLREAARG